MLFESREMKKKVFILDYELISPISLGQNHLFSNLANNTSADRLLKRISTEAIPFKKAAEVQEKLTNLYSNESEIIKEICKYDRKFELLVACYGLASQRMAPLIEKIKIARAGVILGVGADVIPFENLQDKLVSYIRNSKNPLNELVSEINYKKGYLNIINNPYDIHAIFLAEKFNTAEFQHTVLTACVSSTQALAFAYDSIAENESDVVIAGGTDSLINMLAIISFGKLGVISESTEEPCCRPFDINRNGTLAGECAGFAILASEKFVIENKLQPIAQFMGYGNTLDAYKITAPDPGGLSISKAIKNAVDYSGINVSKIDYINAHGTGTKQNDLIELRAFENALGPEVKEIPISSTKDRHGHAIAAAGIQELCVLLECFKNNFIPGNLNLLKPCDSSFNTLINNQSKRINYALTSNFAFGGLNTVLALKNET